MKYLLYAKKSVIFPIHKNGKKDVAENYRPISLTPHIIKIFERIVKQNIVNHLENNDLLGDFQHGFRDKRNCLTQLLEHYSRVLDSIEEGLTIDVIYLDFAKAFDKVDHYILLKKAESLGISGKILEWLREFLTNRTQIVSVSGEISHEKPVLSGVPQGTVLGPILFIIMINDMPLSVIHSLLSSFADDTKVTKVISSNKDEANLQEDLANIYKFAEQNNLSFNSSKFSHLRYNPNSLNSPVQDNQSIYLTADNNFINTKDSVKDLGVLMSSNLKFEDQINSVRSKCKQLIGWILRTFKTRQAMPMMTLWKSLVLSQLDYCSQLWCPTKVCNLQMLEALQRTFTSYISDTKHLDYWDRLKFFKLYSIERRFERYLVIYMWKIVEQKVPSPCAFNLSDPNSRLGRQFYIECLPNTSRSTQTIVFNSPINRGKRLFNKMPKEIRNISNVSVDTFKHQLDKFLNQLPDEPGIPSYTQLRPSVSNCLIDQINYKSVVSKTQPGPCNFN